jgi:RNA polymerase sigma-54 factor
MQNLRFEQKMLQKLSPQQIQLMKLLQIPTVSLEQRIKEELEANPALEEGDKNEDPLEFKDSDDLSNDDNTEETFELDDYLTEYLEDDPSSYKMKDGSYGGDEEDKTMPIAVENTFHDFLDRQLGLLRFKDEKEEALARQIVGSIDEDGYLRRDPIAIIDDLMFAQNIFVSEEEVQEMLHTIQRFDPPGVAARDLQECLSIQLHQRLELIEEGEHVEGFPEEELRLGH